MSEEIVTEEVVEEVATEEDTPVEEVEETPEEQPEEEIDWEARARKAEALIVKHKKEPVAEKPEKKQPATPSEVEETVLLAQGMDEELLEQLKKVAQVNGSSLIKAQNDPIFVAVKEKFEKDQKSKAASLPASKGAGSVKKSKDVSSPGLSREEHKALAAKLK